MRSWTVLCASVAILSAVGLVNAAPSVAVRSKNLVANENRVRRTPLRIVVDKEPIRSRGSITYLNNEIHQQPTPVTQLLAPAQPYGSAKVTKIRPVPSITYASAPGSVEDPIKVSLSASPLRLLPLQPVSDEPQQKKYFGSSNYVDEYQEPLKIKVVNSVPATATVAPAAPAVQYNYETTFADHEWQASPKVPKTKKAVAISKSSFKLDGLDDSKELIIDKLAKLDKYRLKSAEDSGDESNSDESSDSSSSSSEEDGNSSSSSSSEEDSSEEQAKSGEEDKKENNYYSQIRNDVVVKHQPSPLNNIHLAEKLGIKKTGIVYSEDGYNDKTYDHGKFAKLYEVHQRYRRDLSQPIAAQDEDNFEILPIPLALEKVKQMKNLTGAALMAYIQELINNSSLYLSDEQNARDSNHFNSLLLNSTEIKRVFTHPKASEPQPESSNAKYPILRLPVSALRNAENPKHFPTPGKTYYDTKKVPVCGDIEPDLKELEKGDSTVTKKKRNRRLGVRLSINCLKAKHFGDDPFDNPFFQKETKKIESADEQKRNETVTTGKVYRQSTNPSFNVYDDVISNIRSAIVDQQNKVKNRNQQEILKLKSKVADSEFSETSNAEQVVVEKESQRKGDIFDISKFIPQVYYNPNEEILYAVRQKKKKSNKKKTVPSKSISTTIPPPPEVTTYHRLLTHQPKIISYRADPTDYQHSKLGFQPIYHHHPHTQRQFIPSHFKPIAPTPRYPYAPPPPTQDARRRRFHYERHFHAHLI